MDSSKNNESDAAPGDPDDVAAIIGKLEQRLHTQEEHRFNKKKNYALEKQNRAYKTRIGTLEKQKRTNDKRIERQTNDQESSTRVSEMMDRANNEKILTHLSNIKRHATERPVDSEDGYVTREPGEISRLLGREELSLFSKRTAPESLSSIPPPKKAKSSVPEKLIPCNKCFANGWECNKEQPCHNCKLRNKTRECMRVKCRNYVGNLCQNIDCQYAHEHDGYTYLTAHTKLCRGQPGLEEPSKKESKYDKDDYKFDDSDSDSDGSPDSDDKDELSALLTAE